MLFFSLFSTETGLSFGVFTVWVNPSSNNKSQSVVKNSKESLKKSGTREIEPEQVDVRGRMKDFRERIGCSVLVK